METLWLVAAFVFGALSSKLGLPPLVGYLMAGFALNILDIESHEVLSQVADAGVTLLLFTIGLKLKPASLAKPEVWAGSILHMVLTLFLFGLAIRALAVAGIFSFHFLGWESALLVAFALSFSSTVFAVKVLEGKKEMAGRHAGAAVGILIMQDLIAVVFLAVSGGKVPSPWAVALVVGLLAVRPFLGWFMNRCGHGELLMLFGILMAVVGYGGFERVGLKGDLGALAAGMLLAAYPKATELSERLLGFKELFLVGFFLNIGISGTVTLQGLAMAMVLALLMPVKSGIYFLLLTRFKLRARTAVLATFALSNYSEFGLIVCSVGVATGWITHDWLVVLAIALSLTFILASPLNAASHLLYARFGTVLKQFETHTRLPEDQIIDPGDAKIVVFGMGGVGTSAYDEMQRRYGQVVMGVDFDTEKVRAHQHQGRLVLYGDAEDSDFWERVDPASSSITLVMMALPNPDTSLFAIRQMLHRGYQGHITVSVRYEDEKAGLIQEGIPAVYSLYEEAGVGFADHACVRLDACSNKSPASAS